MGVLDVGGSSLGGAVSLHAILLSSIDRVCTDSYADINHRGSFSSGGSDQSQSDREEEAAFTPSH